MRGAEVLTDLSKILSASCAAYTFAFTMLVAPPVIQLFSFSDLIMFSLQAIPICVAIMCYFGVLAMIVNAERAIFQFIQESPRISELIGARRRALRLRLKESSKLSQSESGNRSGIWLMISCAIPPLVAILSIYLRNPLSPRETIGFLQSLGFATILMWTTLGVMLSLSLDVILPGSALRALTRGESGSDRLFWRYGVISLLGCVAVASWQAAVIRGEFEFSDTNFPQSEIFLSKGASEVRETVSITGTVLAITDRAVVLILRSEKKEDRILSIIPRQRVEEIRPKPEYLKSNQFLCSVLYLC
jgi:hypothetical protein